MIVAGCGFRAGAAVESLASALAATGVARPDVLAAPEDKCAAPVFRAFAEGLGLTVRAIPPDTLAATETTTQSPRVLAKRGTGSVAEAAALSAAGPGARLICPRMVSADHMATCAIAEGPDP